MINPSDINVSQLPSVALSDRAQLPETPSIYFAIDSLGTVQYIGRSINPCQRWKQHHRTPELTRLDGVRIAYMTVEADLLPAVETALIEWFDPVLNGLRTHVDAPSRDHSHRLICRLQTLMDIYNARVADTGEGERLTQKSFAKQAGISITTFRRLYKNEASRVDFNTVEALCRVLGCEAGDLLMLKENSEND